MNDTTSDTIKTLQSQIGKLLHDEGIQEVFRKDLSFGDVIATSYPSFPNLFAIRIFSIGGFYNPDRKDNDKLEELPSDARFFRIGKIGDDWAELTNTTLNKKIYSIVGRSLLAPLCTFVDGLNLITEGDLYLQQSNCVFYITVKDNTHEKVDPRNNLIQGPIWKLDLPSLDC